MMMLRGGSNRVVPDVPLTPQRTSRTISPSAVMARSSPRTRKRKLMVKELVLSSIPSPRSPRRIIKSLRARSRQHIERQAEKLADRNLTQFLTIDCPTDVLPKILAFAGPISAAALQQTSRHFWQVLNAEGTWRGLCEELYKVSCTDVCTVFVGGEASSCYCECEN